MFQVVACDQGQRGPESRNDARGCTFNWKFAYPPGGVKFNRTTRSPASVQRQGPTRALTVSASMSRPDGALGGAREDPSESGHWHPGPSSRPLRAPDSMRCRRLAAGITVGVADGRAEARRLDRAAAPARQGRCSALACPAGARPGASAGSRAPSLARAGPLGRWRAHATCTVSLAGPVAGLPPMWACRVGMPCVGLF